MDPLRPVKTTLLLQSIVSNVLSRFLSQYQQKRTWRYVQYSYLPATVFRQQGSEGFMFCCRSYARHIRGDQTPVVDLCFFIIYWTAHVLFLYDLQCPTRKTTPQEVLI